MTLKTVIILLMLKAHLIFVPSEKVEFSLDEVAFSILAGFYYNNFIAFLVRFI